MSNRAERRRMMRQETKRSQALLDSYSKNQRIAGLIQNGITLEDVEKSYREGFSDGMRSASIPIFRAMYAAICVSLHETYGFGAKRCMNVLEDMEERLLWALGHEELIDEVFQKIGLTIQFNDDSREIQLANGGTT